jgi:hypothetical protein
MTVTETKHLISVVKKAMKSQASRKRADRLKQLVQAKICTANGKLSKQYR